MYPITPQRTCLADSVRTKDLQLTEAKRQLALQASPEGQSEHGRGLMARVAELEALVAARDNSMRELRAELNVHKQRLDEQKTLQKRDSVGHGVREEQLQTQLKAKEQEHRDEVRKLRDRIEQLGGADMRLLESNLKETERRNKALVLQVEQLTGGRRGSTHYEELFATARCMSLLGADTQAEEVVLWLMPLFFREF